jgi:hypothetical protein
MCRVSSSCECRRESRCERWVPQGGVGSTLPRNFMNTFSPRLLEMSGAKSCYTTDASVLSRGSSSKCYKNKHEEEVTEPIPLTGSSDGRRGGGTRRRGRQRGTPTQLPATTPTTTTTTTNTTNTATTTDTTTTTALSLCRCRTRSQGKRGGSTA